MQSLCIILEIVRVSCVRGTFGQGGYLQHTTFHVKTIKAVKRSRARPRRRIYDYGFKESKKKKAGDFHFARGRARRRAHTAQGKVQKLKRVNVPLDLLSSY